VDDALLVRLLQPEDARHVGMLQGSEHLGLATKPGQALGVLGEVLGEEFEGHLAVEPGVAGAMHLAHAALPEWGQDLVVT